MAVSLPTVIGRPPLLTDVCHGMHLRQDLRRWRLFIKHRSAGDEWLAIRIHATSRGGFTTAGGLLHPIAAGSGLARDQGVAKITPAS